MLAAVTVFGSLGDTLLARGMKGFGSIDVHHLSSAIGALGNPFVLLGIGCLLGFMASYMTALSFADLTFVLPATAFGYVIMTILSIVWLHEQVSLARWVGVLFIVVGVGLVAGGPSRTELSEKHTPAAKFPATSLAHPHCEPPLAPPPHVRSTPFEERS